MRPRDDPFVLWSLDRRRRKRCQIKWCENPVKPPHRFCSFYHVACAVLGEGHPRIRRERTRIVKKHEAWYRAHKIPVGEWPMWLFLSDDLDEIPWEDFPKHGKDGPD